VILYNTDVSQKEIAKLPFRIQKDVTRGPTRLLVCEAPSVGLPLVIRHDSSDVYFSGFGLPTKDLRWTGRGSAEVEFFLEEPSPGHGLYRITLSLMSLERQVIRLSLNNAEIVQLALAERPYKLIFNATDEILNLHGHNTLKIDLLNAQRLNEWGKETRGIGFVKFELDGSPPSSPRAG